MALQQLIIPYLFPPEDGEPGQILVRSGSARTIDWASIDLSVYERVGVAAGLLAGHESTYDHSAFLTAVSLAGYVPYTGATGDVDLGEFGLRSDSYRSGDLISVPDLFGDLLPTQMSLNATETRVGGNFVSFMQKASLYTVLPSAVATNESYVRDWGLIRTPEENTERIGGLAGRVNIIAVKGTGVVDFATGATSQIANYGTITNAKASWDTIGNYGTISGLCYSHQSDVNNYAYTANGTSWGAGSTATAYVARYKIFNAGYSQGASITTAAVINANIQNAAYTGGSATIGTAYGMSYDLSNAAGCTIGTSYGIYLGTPSNSGTLTNHYGLYLADQRVSGATNNYAVYVADGVSYFGGGVTAKARAADAVALTVQGYTGQTANLQEWRNSTGDVLASVGPTGVFSGLSGYVPYTGATGDVDLGSHGLTAAVARATDKMYFCATGQNGSYITWGQTANYLSLHGFSEINFCTWEHGWGTTGETFAALTIKQSGYLGINTKTPTAQLHVKPGAADVVGFKVDSYAGQTADLVNIDGKVVVDKSGNVNLGPTVFYSDGSLVDFTYNGNIVIYASRSASTLGLGAGGAANGLNINRYNQVGINQTNQGARLDVQTESDADWEYEVGLKVALQRPTQVGFILKEASGQSGLMMKVTDSFDETKCGIGSANVGFFSYDAVKTFFGTGSDASVTYNGTNMVFNSREVGTGDFVFSGGNVGIGTTTPGAKFQINPGAANVVGQIIKLYTGQTANAFEIQPAGSTTPVFGVDASGRLGVGDAPSSAYRLYVNGNSALIGTVLAQNTLTTVAGTNKYLYSGAQYMDNSDGAVDVGYAFLTQLWKRGTSNIAGVYGFQSILCCSAASAGVVSSARGIDTSLVINDGSTATWSDYRGINISISKPGTGTILNAYGIYIGDLTKAATHYGLYVASVSPNYLAGNVGIGRTPALHALEVNGNVQATAFYGSTTNLAHMKLDMSNVVEASFVYNSMNKMKLRYSGVVTIPGQLGVGTANDTLAAQFELYPKDATTVGQLIKLYTGQTANAFEIQPADSTTPFVYFGRPGGTYQLLVEGNAYLSGLLTMAGGRIVIGEEVAGILGLNGYDSIAFKTKASSVIIRALMGTATFVVNDDGYDYDTRIESDNNPYALMVDGGQDAVILAAPAAAPTLPGNSTYAISLDETNHNLIIGTKYSDGTSKTAKLALGRTFTILLNGSSWIGDSTPIVTGDLPAAEVEHVGRQGWAFDAGDTEEAIISAVIPWPQQYTGGTLKADIYFAMASDNANDIQLDMRVEAITPGDTLDLEAASSFDAANTGTVSLAGSTAGDLKKLTITLTNKDSVAAGDLVRFLLRRDTTSENDDAAGDLFVYSVSIYEEV